MTDKRKELIKNLTCDELRFKEEHCSDCSIPVHDEIEIQLHDKCMLTKQVYN